MNVRELHNADELKRTINLAVIDLLNLTKRPEGPTEEHQGWAMGYYTLTAQCKEIIDQVNTMEYRHEIEKYWVAKYNYLCGMIKILNSVKK